MQRVHRKVPRRLQHPSKVPQPDLRLPISTSPGFESGHSADRESPVRNIPHHRGSRSKPGSLADRNVLADTNARSEHDKIAQSDAAAQPRLTGYDAMVSDNNVVGDLNEVVDLGSLADNRIANPAPIDRRSGSDLDIVFNYNNADLRHLEMPGCAHNVAEAVLADVATRMDNNSISNDRVRD